MQMRYAVLGLMSAVGLLLGNPASPGIAAQEHPKETALPRSFQGARLGMTLSELTTAVPTQKEYPSIDVTRLSVQW